MLIHKINDILYTTDPDAMDHIIARYIKQNLSVISTLSIEQLAGACYVSNAKISKFCRALGYENFIAFKDACRTMNEAQIVTSRQLYKNSTWQLDILERNLSRLDLEQAGRLAEQINEASIVYLFGSSYSNALTKLLQIDMDTMNIPAIVLDERLQKPYPIDQSALLIVLSIEGKGLKYDERRLGRIGKLPCTTWLVSASPTYAKHFDHTLLIPAEDCDLHARRMLMVHVLDWLSAHFSKRKI